MIRFSSMLFSLCLVALVAGTAAAKEDFRKVYKQGVELNKKGEYEKAIAAYTRAIALKPNEAGLYFVRGRAYRQADKLDNAITDFTKAITLKPAYAEAYNERGITYIGKGDKTNYLLDFKKGCDLKYENACKNLKKFK